LFWKNKLERDLDEELRMHISLETDQNVRRGMTPEDARRAALRRFGGVEQTKESYRDRRGLPTIEFLLQDFRYALRLLRKNAGFTVVAVLTLALGIGANTALFSAVRAMMINNLAYPHADRLMHIWAYWPGGFGNMPYPDYVALRERSHSFVDLAACESWGSVALTGRDRPIQLRTNFATPNYLELLGARPVAGRVFRPDEDRIEGAHPVVILSHELWRGQFGGNPAMVGRTIHLNGAPYTVVGVMSPAFHGLGEVEDPPAADVWLPITMARSLLGQPPLTDQAYSIYWGLGLLKPGVSIQEAREDLNEISRQIEKEQPNTHQAHGLKLEPVTDYANGQFRRPLLLLTAGALLILLIGCANIANSLLARLALRRREMAVRSAMGASYGRLSRQLLIECGVLAAAGGAAGLLLALAITQTLGRWSLQNVSSLVHVEPDRWALICAGALTVGTAILLTLLQSAGLRRSGISETLRESGRPGMSAGRSGLRRTLVVAEVGLSVVLLIGAGLMLRSFENLVNSGVGFRMDHLLTLRLGLRGAKYANPADRVVFAEAFVSKASALPGVKSVSLFGPSMLGHATWVMSVFPQERPVKGPEDFVQVCRHSINPRALANLGIAVQRGREFNQFDTANSAPVAIISESIARELWPGMDAVGRQLKRPDPTLPPLTIVGVAADAKHRERYSLEDVASDWPLGGLGPQRDIYLPYAQRPNGDLTVALRIGIDSASVTQSLMAMMAGLDADLPLDDVRMLDDRIAEQSQAPAALAGLIGAYALLALFLAGLGIYGIVSQSVSQRTQEIGIRVALGAQASDVFRMVLREGLGMIAIGVAAGLAGAWGLTRLMSSLLYGVSPNDAIAFASAVPLLVLAGLLACLIPARRAMRVDPMVALRYE
jgi:putative ABC transport system permease protein